jgi:hypothetical protein
MQILELLGLTIKAIIGLITEIFVWLWNFLFFTYYGVFILIFIDISFISVMSKFDHPGILYWILIILLIIGIIYFIILLSQSGPIEG